MSDLVLTEEVTGFLPGAGKHSVYVKTDGNFYTKNSAGTETPITGSALYSQALTDFANNAGTTTGLTYGYQAGVIRSDNATTSVAAGTVALTASTTNYVEVTGAGVVSANTVGFTSGSFPLATVATGASSITTITDKRGFASVGGGAIGFSAYKGGTNQSVTKSSLVKITFNTTSFDTASEFDTTNSKWVPKSSGIKLITAAIVIVGSSAVAGESISLRLYKNGSQVANGGGIMCTNASDVGLSASFLQQANGTTDYFEVYTYWGGSGTGTVYGLLGTTSFAGAALK